MNEITKLYENARVKPTYTDECQMADSYYSMEKDLNERGILFDDYMKQNCPNKNELCYETCPYAYNKEFYPPFTAEKQIAILQFCLKWGQVHILKGIDDEYRIENSCYRQGYQPTIADAIANYINEKWEKLTPEEKQQVKGILE